MTDSDHSDIVNNFKQIFTTNAKLPPGNPGVWGTPKLTGHDKANGGGLSIINPRVFQTDEKT